MNEIKFPYKPNLLIFISSGVVMSGIAVGLGYVAQTNDQGLILNHVIKFSVAGATIFYWCLAGACALLTLFGAIAVIGGLITKKEILVSDNSISAPKSGISKQRVTLNFQDVTDVTIQSIHKQKFLNIVHPNGKLTIPQSMLPSKKLFEELTELVARKINGSQVH